MEVFARAELGHRERLRALSIRGVPVEDLGRDLADLKADVGTARNTRCLLKTGFEQSDAQFFFVAGADALHLRFVPQANEPLQFVQGENGRDFVPSLFADGVGYQQTTGLQERVVAILLVADFVCHGEDLNRHLAGSGVGHEKLQTEACAKNLHDHVSLTSLSFCDQPSELCSPVPVRNQFF